MRITKKTNERIENSLLIIEKYKKFVSCQYAGKSKIKYLRLLSRAEIPKIVCVDENSRNIYYKIKGKIHNRSGKMAWKIPIFNKKIDISVLSSISSLFSGKKQEACRITSIKRRNEDGSYKGIDKTMDFLRITGGMRSRHLKIIKNRRKNNTINRTDKRSIEDVRRELLVLEPRYSLLSESYQDNKKKLQFLCNSGHVFFMKWNSFLSSNQRCPQCHIFKKEEECRGIFEKLTNKNFPKKKPYFLKIPETGGIMELDGYCEDLKMAFEYDGEGHYLPIRPWGGEKGLLSVQKRDKIKNVLCKEYGIVLIRIPYFVKNLEKFIKEALSGKDIIG